MSLYWGIDLSYNRTCCSVLDNVLGRGTLVILSSCPSASKYFQDHVISALRLGNTFKQFLNHQKFISSDNSLWIEEPPVGGSYSTGLSLLHGVFAPLISFIQDVKYVSTSLIKETTKLYFDMPKPSKVHTKRLVMESNIWNWYDFNIYKNVSMSPICYVQFDYLSKKDEKHIPADAFDSIFFAMYAMYAKHVMFKNDDIEYPDMSQKTIRKRFKIDSFLEYYIRRDNG